MKKARSREPESSIQLLKELAKCLEKRGQKVSINTIRHWSYTDAARLAQPLHDCGMGPLSKTALPGPKEEKERKAYFDEVAREWKEGQRNRYLFKWGILRPTIDSALSTGPSTNDPIPTGWSVGQPSPDLFNVKVKVTPTNEMDGEVLSEPFKLATLLGTSRLAVIGWKSGAKAEYRSLINDLKVGRYTHNPFEYMDPGKYLDYEAHGKRIENGEVITGEQNPFDLNQAPPSKEPGATLTHFEEEYQRLNQRIASSRIPFSEGTDISALPPPTLPSLLLTDPPYFGPDTLTPKIKERPPFTSAVPTRWLPHPETKIRPSEPQGSHVPVAS